MNSKYLKWSIFVALIFTFLLNINSVSAVRIVEHNDIPWIENSTFDNSGIPWSPNIIGDPTDFDLEIDPGQADYELSGDIRTFSEISGTPQASDWIEFNHSVRPLPLTHEINQHGLNVSHVYDEDASGDFPNSGDQTANLAGVLWKRNISLTADMSDYIITSASINAVVNGSADTDLETPNDHPPFADGGYASLFDFTRFYVEISDLNDIESYEVASNKTLHLGQTYAGRRVYSYATRDFMADTNMTYVDEDVLKFALTQVLKHDNHNFTVTLGIEIDCEDNYPGYELDVWYSLLIKSCDLSFTYVKKIDQSSSISWNQIGNQVNGTNVQITDANLTFKYKIDQVWPTSLSPNSEFRIVINDKQYSETIKLSTIGTNFTEAKLGGFNVTSLINLGINITLSIQIFIADEFGLDRTIKLSIDDVYLNISWTESFSDPDDPWFATGAFIISLIAAGLIGAYLIAYQKYLKFPIPVRRVRKYQKTLDKDETPKIPIKTRERAFKSKFRSEFSKTEKIMKKPQSEKEILIPKKQVIKE